MTDDSELLRRFATGDANSENAFAEFVERRVGFVYGAALRQTAGNAHLAGDIAQAVFLAASKKAALLARHERISGWLHTTTTLTARTMLRDARLRRAREQEAAAMNELLHDTTTNPAAPDHAGQMRETLDEALGRLGEQDREIVLMRFFENRDFAEIGARMSLNEAAARKRVARALEKLRALYARRGVTSTAAALGALMTAEAATAAPAGLATTISGTILASGATAAAATTTTTAGILAFMTTTKIAIITTAVALLVATLATLEVRREKSAATSLDTLKRKHTALLKNLGDTQKSAKANQAVVERLRRQKAEGAKLAENPRDPVTAGNAFLAEHPEIQAMLFDAYKARMAGVFYPLYKKLNLTPEQIAVFEDAFVRSSRSFVEKNIPGIGKAELAMNPKVDPYNETAAKLKEALGTENIDKIDLYLIGGHSTTPDHIAGQSVTDLAYNLYYTGTPLTAEQGERLDHVFYTASAKGGKKTPAAYWNEVLEQSGAILSEPQMSVLRQMRAQSDLESGASKQSDASSNTRESQ